MTMCIKSNNLDLKKLDLDKRRKFEKNTPVIWHHLNYKYDTHITKRLYILTDWVNIKDYKYQYGKNNIIFNIDNNDLIKSFKKIHQNIKFPKNNIQNNNKDIEITDDSDDEPVIIKKTISKTQIYISESESDDEPYEPKKKINIQSTQNNHNNDIDFNTLITFNKNENDNIDNNNEDIDLEEDDYNNYPLIFKDKSQLKLIPSKKSEKQEYILDKIENRSEIEIYFPTINKNNNNFKVVGKFLLYITVSCYGDYFGGNSFKIYIDSGELKYEKTHVQDDILKSKGIYNDMIKLEI